MASCGGALGKLDLGYGRHPLDRRREPDQKLCLYELRSPAAGWNWTKAACEFPLLNRVDVGGVQFHPRWTYRDGSVDKSDGTKVTIRFTSSSPALELKSVWHARSGPGPVRHQHVLRNNAGGRSRFTSRKAWTCTSSDPAADTASGTSMTTAPDRTKSASTTIAGRGLSEDAQDLQGPGLDSLRRRRCPWRERIRRERL